MNAEAAYEREAIVGELNAVIRELEAVAVIASRQRGIGCERLVMSANALAQRYRGVRNRVLALP